MDQLLVPSRKPTTHGLYFDPVDDYVAMPDSPFYDFGLENFSLWIRAYLVDSNSGDLVNTTQDLIGKRLNVGDKYVLAVASNRILFALGNTAGAGVNIQTVAPVPLGRFVDICFRRVGGASGNNLVSNYHIFLDGVQQSTTSYQDVTTLQSWNATFGAPFTFQSAIQDVSVIRKHMFVGGAGCWNRALTNQEIAAITANNPPAAGGRGLWPFSHTSGKTVADFSSVGKNGVLFNRTDLEAGIPDPATNRIWLPTAALFPLTSATPSVTKVFNSPHAVTGFLTVGILPNPVSWALTSSTGVAKDSGTLPATTTTAASYTGRAVAIAAGDTLQFTTTGISAAANAAVGLFWPANEPESAMAASAYAANTGGTYTSTYRSTY